MTHHHHGNKKHSHFATSAKSHSDLADNHDCSQYENANPHGYIFAERGSKEWDAAWAVLITLGCDPEKYMLMHGEPDGGSVRWGFKHIDTREYTYITV